MPTAYCSIFALSALRQQRVSGSLPVPIGIEDCHAIHRGRTADVAGSRDILFVRHIGYAVCMFSPISLRGLDNLLPVSGEYVYTIWEGGSSRVPIMISEQKGQQSDNRHAFPDSIYVVLYEILIGLTPSSSSSSSSSSSCTTTATTITMVMTTLTSVNAERDLALYTSFYVYGPRLYILQ